MVYLFCYSVHKCESSKSSGGMGKVGHESMVTIESHIFPGNSSD